MSISDALKDEVATVLKERNDLSIELERLRKVFVQLRQHVRHHLFMAGIASNPGWSDQDVLDGITQWSDLTLRLRKENAELRGK